MQSIIQPVVGFADSVIDLEAGLTLTDTIGVDTSFAPADILGSRNTDSVFAFDITGLDGSSGGMIFEAGAVGVSIYIGFRANGDFIYRAGNGGTPWNANTAYIEVSSGQPSGDGTLVVDVIPGAPISVRAWWNGVAIGTPIDGASSSNYAGTGTGGYLVTSGASVPTGEITTRVSYSTASALRYYENQTASI